MAETCWICGFKIDKREYEDIVYTKAGIVHGYCLEFYPLEVQDGDENPVHIAQCND